jgi:hypothetical protein
MMIIGPPQVIRTWGGLRELTQGVEDFFLDPAEAAFWV